ncbi:MAG TPA: pitrilysin family protein [Terriglobia bacterium]|nr:pitrilysin family protein [Terriglobia bacterium]
MPNVRKDVLPNGLTILTESMSSVRSVSVGIWLRTGARQETAEDNGISHFIEHMLFKGTTHRSAEDIARAADSIGGHLDAFTAKETTNYSIKVLDEHLPRAFGILADLVKNPLFEPAHISNESRVIQEEIKMVEDTPDDLVHEIFTQTYWRGHALGRPILGTRRSVKGFDRKRLFGYFRRHYAPNNMLIAAAGHIKHSQIVDLVQEEFGDLPAGPALRSGPIPVPHPHLQVRHKKDLEQVHLCVGAPSYPQPHKNRFPSYILNSVLGGGMSSRLFQNIREKRGLAYAVFSSLSSFHDAGCLSVYAGTATDKTRQVIELILKEFCELKSNPIGHEELQRAKDYLKGSLLLSLESSTSRMGNVARQEMYFRRYISQDEIARSVDAVTAEQVMAVAQEFLRPERLAITVLGPINGLKLERSDLDC